MQHALSRECFGTNTVFCDRRPAFSNAVWGRPLLLRSREHLNVGNANGDETLSMSTAR